MVFFMDAKDWANQVFFSEKKSLKSQCLAHLFENTQCMPAFYFYKKELLFYAA